MHNINLIYMGALPERIAGNDGPKCFKWGEANCHFSTLLPHITYFPFQYKCIAKHTVSLLNLLTWE